jgi:hypothetical protein
MARVLVVSRNPAMAMGLSATDYEVVDLRPPEFGDWITGGEDADALILDLENPKLAVAAVTNLRAHAKLAPVLLVSSDRPGWDDPEMRQLPATEVLPLPISRPALLSALQDLIIEPWAHNTMPPQHAEVTQALQELMLDPSDLLSEDDGLDALLRDSPPQRDAVGKDVSRAAGPELLEETQVADEAAALHELEAAPERETVPEPEVAHEVEAVAEPMTVTVEHVAVPSPEAHVARPAPAVEDKPVAAPGGVATEPPPLSAVPRTQRSTRLPAGASSSLRDMEALRPSAASTATVAPPARPPRGRDNRKATPVASSTRTEGPAPTPAVPPRAARGDQPDDSVDLVRRLSRVARTLYGVPETAEVVIVDAVERTHADAGALMIPDDGAWRVAAGVGLRPLETRYELHVESWVVQQVARGHMGVIVEESDIAREQLQGAPLASWRHLMAAPIPRVEALLLVARRDDPPFDEGNLTVLAALGSEAGPLLSAAIDTRSLARTLWEFRDEPDPPH